MIKCRHKFRLNLNKKSSDCEIRICITNKKIKQLCFQSIMLIKMS